MIRSVTSDEWRPPRAVDLLGALHDTVHVELPPPKVARFRRLRRAGKQSSERRNVELDGGPAKADTCLRAE